MESGSQKRDEKKTTPDKRRIPHIKKSGETIEWLILKTRKPWYISVKAYKTAKNSNRFACDEKTPKIRAIKQIMVVKTIKKKTSQTLHRRLYNFWKHIPATAFQTESFCC
ncbi:hypothetical protein GMD83_12965 [Pseudoflavonifractor sp. BIOML-A7]|jgi:hypothetical protein|nr:MULTISPECIES: hypothetical protein [unclassified Pseudoflavonifractor]MTR47025.1 hypothetical protein [Pseudoflavonifractor sp. BIOML-A13]MTS61489.1 hypothetical protein [Pseudoflavonifractor sp. BIOML-A7]MTS92945.1 hypothetical protein [Pseudoflavonifractor sp. BIOML-A4]MTS94975.1 hypothetical protein [Pseudoflavonifractor sp. BIOML-A1]